MTLYDTIRTYLENSVPFALATVVAGPIGLGAKLVVRENGTADGRLATPELACRVAGDGMQLLREERSGTIVYELDEGTFDVFIQSFPAPSTVLIVGASGAAQPLAHFAKALDYRVIVTDARAAFAEPSRFPDADAVIKGWPQDILPGLPLDERTYVVLLSHDPKFDEPTLDIVLPSRVPYIGAIGSRNTQRERFQRLQDKGYTPEQLARIYGPVGLDLGGRSVEETALAILAEITAVRHRRQGGSMRRRLESVTAEAS
jgi:xanthine dehydrogenase accessory factor